MPRKRGQKDIERSMRFNENKRLRLEAEQAARLANAQNETANAPAYNRDEPAVETPNTESAHEPAVGTPIAGSAPEPTTVQVPQSVTTGQEALPNIANGFFAEGDDDDIIFDAGNLEPQQQQFVFDEGHQQPSERLVSSQGGCDSLNPTALVPATGLDLPSTGSLAMLPVDPPVTGPTEDVEEVLDVQLAGPVVTAGYDYYDERDQILRENGYKPFREMSNKAILQYYDRCSDTHHLLSYLLNPGIRKQAQSLVEIAQNIVSKGPHGCKPKRTLMFRFSKRVWCAHCDQELFWQRCWLPERLIATLNEPIENTWMAVILNRGGTCFLFDTSARCCLYQKSKHCQNKDHLRLETKRQNAIRASHHTGRTGCWDPDPCLDNRVVHKQLTDHEVANGQYQGHSARA